MLTVFAQRINFNVTSVRSFKPLRSKNIFSPESHQNKTMIDVIQNTYTLSSEELNVLCG